MSKMVSWLQVREERMFYFFNHKLQHHSLDRVLGALTHFGGATLTIFFSVFLWAVFPQPLKTVGLQCMLALTLSHIPVAIIKRVYPRLRPYLVMPNTKTGKSLLKDHSFPSGHTTAVFSTTIPIILFAPILATFILPLALIVGISRIYLGLHYPSDVVVGAFIGTGAAIFSVAMIG